jgi:Xaa-Pro aminopeptidase
MRDELAGLLSSRGAGPESGPLYVSLGASGHREVVEAVLNGKRAAPAAGLIARLRQVKDEEEIRRLREAVRITGEALREAMRAAEPGDWEYEIEAVIEYLFRTRGAERVGFPSIVGSGPNSTVLHYDESRRRTELGDLVVADVGAEYGYYSADITRTFPVSGRFTERQRAVYELVLGAQEAALERIRPGVTTRELGRAAREYMTRHSGDLCGARSCTAYFVHGLSHWLGMDVHDVGPRGVALEPGMVLTVEPGIYLADENLGVRIEDDVLVTPEGYEILSADVPRDPDEIEALMARSPRWIRGESGAGAGTPGDGAPRR